MSQNGESKTNARRVTRKRDPELKGCRTELAKNKGKYGLGKTGRKRNARKRTATTSAKGLTSGNILAKKGGL